MKIHHLHNWDIDYKDAVKIQNELKKNLTLLPLTREIRIAAGVDVSSNKNSNKVFASAVAWDIEKCAVLEVAYFSGETDFPYIPGLLAFRELPVITKALEKLRCTADIILVDGHGISHPRGLGIASHLGLMVDVPTIGCAKKKFVGDFKQPSNIKNSSSNLMYKGQIIGSVLRTRTNVKPVFVSPGNNIDVQSAVKVVKMLSSQFRIPQPLRYAHIECNKLRRNSLLNN